MFTLETYLTPPRPRLLAHRGLALDVPENTLLAFERAWQAGARYLETDVHLTSDGEVVISHDPTLTRLTGSPAAIATHTMSHLRAVDLGSGAGFCSLAEALDAFPTARFNIDVKVAPALLPTIAVVERLRAEARVLLASFSERRRRHVQQKSPAIATSSGRSGVLRFAAATLCHAPPTWGAVALSGATVLQVPEKIGSAVLVTDRFISAAHRLGVEVHVWTVNEPREMRRLVERGVDGIVTDRIDLAVAEFGSAA